MLGITRYRQDSPDPQQMHQALVTALAAFASCPGYRQGQIAQATDDPALWTMVVDFDTMGSYRRALSSYRVKAEAVPVMYQALDAPSAFAPTASHDGQQLTEYVTDLIIGGTRGDGQLAPDTQNRPGMSS